MEKTPNAENSFAGEKSRFLGAIEEATSLKGLGTVIENMPEQLEGVFNRQAALALIKAVSRSAATGLKQFTTSPGFRMLAEKAKLPELERRIGELADVSTETVQGSEGTEWNKPLRF